MTFTPLHLIGLCLLLAGCSVSPSTITVAECQERMQEVSTATARLAVRQCEATIDEIRAVYTEGIREITNSIQSQ